MKKSGKPTPASQIKELEKDPALQELCLRLLPSNYEFEIAKTVWRIQRIQNCKTVALQMPEGLLLFATGIADVLQSYTGVDTILMGDITYGACCVDDYTAHLLGADLLVHYGHSCLVPTSVANLVDTIYIFVTIKFDVDHAVESIQTLLTKGVEAEECEAKIRICSEEELTQKGVSVALVSTIQFAMSLPVIKESIQATNVRSDSKSIQITIPRLKPLSGGEILGCTAPKVMDDLIVYVGDGRFHLEAIMMANPTLKAYRYDPYNKTMTHEKFDHVALSKARQVAVEGLVVKTGQVKGELTIGVILGTLGRQGNVIPVEHVYNHLVQKGYNVFMVLMSEISPAKLNLFRGVDLWVQFACPRLSIDWGSAFRVPILTPFEAIWGSDQVEVNGGQLKYTGHPMDYYAYDSLGPHTPNYKPTIVKPKL